MAQNVEIKARLKNPKQTKKMVEQLATSYLGLDIQEDTYFSTKAGRFKLRISQLDGVYLIPYLRSDEASAKKSVYAKIPVEDAALIKKLFRKIFGIHKIVRKKREIFLYHNVRIHLDHVAELGYFFELEAVLDQKHNDEKKEREKVSDLLQKLHIAPGDLVEGSYENMI